MKFKTLLIFTLLLTNLQATNFHDQGIQAYANKEYQKAYSALNTYAKSNQLSIREKFFLARSAYEIGMYEDALKLYLDILLVEENNLRVHLELAQTYYKLEQTEKAREKFSFVLSQDIPENVRQNITLRLSQMKKIEKRHFFSANIYAGIGYDSNVENSADAGNYSVYIPTVDSTIALSNDGKKINDTILEVAASINHNYILDKNTYIKNSLTSATYTYKDMDEKNLNALSLASEYNKYYKTIKLGFGGGYDYVSLDDKKYLDGVNIYFPKIEMAIDKNKRYFLHVKYNQQRFSQNSDKDKNSHTFEFFNRLAYSHNIFGQNFFDITFGSTKKEQGSRTDISKNYAHFAYTNSYALSQTLLLNNRFYISKENYKLKDVNFLTKRKDTEYTFTTTLFKKLSQKLNIGTSISYTENQSNHAVYDYDKYNVKAFLSYNF